MIQLWPHQQAGLAELLAHKYRALWWQPGVGKTAPLAIAGREVGGPQLWLTPASLRTQAVREIARFRGDGATIVAIKSGKTQGIKTADVVVCSYELARTPAVFRELIAREWGSLVCDEAHKLSNPSAQITKAVYGARLNSPGALYKRAKHVWIATGTPITNYPDGLWPHMSRLWPDLAGTTLSAWKDQFCVIRTTHFGEQVVGGKNLVELKERLDRTGSRLMLTDVRDMPPLTIDTIDIETSDIDLSDVDPEARVALEAALSEPDADDAWSLLENMAPALATLRARIAHAKAGAVAAALSEEMDGGLDRLVVFGCHVAALKQCRDALSRYGARLIIGETPAAERDASIEAFERGDVRVLVGNVMSIGTGLNLQCGQRAAFLDAAWSPAQNAQAVARLFRAGQERPVRVSFFSLINSIDSRVQEVLTRKSRIINILEKGEHV
jgi:SWI/SNF-related matrix-associated actin-dependent regulator of chromatin subfamily A-like protein 1